MTAAALLLLQHAFDVQHRPDHGEMLAVAAMGAAASAATMAIASGQPCPICAGLGWTSVEETTPASPSRTVHVNGVTIDLPAGFDRQAMRDRATILCPACHPRSS